MSDRIPRMARTITPDEFNGVCRRLLRMIAHAQIENDITRAAMLKGDPQFVRDLASVRAEVQERWKPALDSLAEATPDSLDDILRKFEGPVQ